MKLFLINVYTAWCGEDQDYLYYANDAIELEDIAQDLAYSNFKDFKQEPSDFGDYEEWEEVEAALESGELIETDYYGYTISEITEQEIEYYDCQIMNPNEKEKTSEN